MNDWLVGRIDTVILDDVQRERIIAWTAQVSGLDPDVVRHDIGARAVIAQDDRDRSYRLHLSRLVRRDGQLVLDLAANHVWTEPVVAPVARLPELEFEVRDGVPYVVKIGDF